MSLAYMLSVTGALQSREAGLSPYRFVESTPLRRDWEQERARGPASVLARLRTGSSRLLPGGEIIPPWLKVSFLLALALLCSGVVRWSGPGGAASSLAPARIEAASRFGAMPVVQPLPGQTAVAMGER